MEFAFVDRITEIDRRSRLTAIRDFTGDEDWFEFHFPGNPTVPGSLLLECLTQAGCALAEISTGLRKKSLPVLVDRLKYRRRVRPGDRLSMEGRVVEWGEEVVRLEMVGRVGQDAVVMAEIALALVPMESIYLAEGAVPAIRGYYKRLLDGATVRGFDAVPEELP